MAYYREKTPQKRQKLDHVPNENQFYRPLTRVVRNRSHHDKSFIPTSIHRNLLLCKYDEFAERTELMSSIRHVTLKLVKCVRPNSFEGYATLQTIILPEMLEKIGDFAFRGCTSLKNIVLPHSCKELGRSAFENCTSLIEIRLDRVVRLGISCFSGCKSLKRVGTLQNVLVIPSSLFEKCFDLQTVLLSNECKEIHACAFKESGIIVLTLPASLTSLGDGCFSLCNRLKSVCIPETVYEIPDMAFEHCKSLIYVELGYAAKIGYAAFSHAASLQEIVIPKTCRSLRDKAFYHCSSLERIQLPNRIKYISHSCFEQCCRLKEVIHNAKGVWGRAFYGCNELSHFDFSCVNEIRYQAFQFSGIQEVICDSYVGEFLVDVYAFAESRVTKIRVHRRSNVGSSAFRQCPLRHIDFGKDPCSFEQNSFGTPTLQSFSCGYIRDVDKIPKAKEIFLYVGTITGHPNLSRNLSCLTKLSTSECLASPTSGTCFILDHYQNMMAVIKRNSVTLAQNFTVKTLYGKIETQSTLYNSSLLFMFMISRKFFPGMDLQDIWEHIITFIPRASTLTV